MKFCAQCKTFYNDLSFTTIGGKLVCFHCYHKLGLKERNSSAGKVMVQR